MTHAQGTQTTPQSLVPVAATGIALVTALVITLAIALGGIPTFDARPGVSGENTALTESAREWQSQREQQGGFTDPYTQAAREWQKQREQQASGAQVAPMAPLDTDPTRPTLR